LVNDAPVKTATKNKKNNRVAEQVRVWPKTRTRLERMARANRWLLVAAMDAAVDALEREQTASRITVPQPQSA
jgi:hypothetical protein